MTFDPTKYIAGPAIITFDSQTYYSQGDIAVKSRLETWNVNTSMHGQIDERLKSRAYEISFVPAGEIEALTKYYPYAVGDIGKSIFATSDKALTIQTLAGQLYTFSRAAMIKMPALNLSTGKTAFGDMTFLALLKTSTAPTDAAAFLTIGAQAFANTSFDESKITTPGYTAAYGLSPYAAMESVDGFAVEIGMGIKYDYVDRFGIINARLTSLTASAKFTPIGLTEAEWESLVLPDGATAVLPGESLAKSNTDLVISKGVGFLKVTINKAGIKEHALSFGEAPRLGELTFTAKRTWTAGAANALFTIEEQSA
jgi:hypothetical protein